MPVAASADYLRCRHGKGEKAGTPCEIEQWIAHPPSTWKVPGSSLGGSNWYKWCSKSPSCNFGTKFGSIVNHFGSNIVFRLDYIYFHNMEKNEVLHDIFSRGGHFRSGADPILRSGLQKQFSGECAPDPLRPDNLHFSNFFLICFCRLLLNQMH